MRLHRYSDGPRDGFLKKWDDELIADRAPERAALCEAPSGSRHRLENSARFDLELIEVQTGSHLGEDDIIRIEDDYHRA